MTAHSRRRRKKKKKKKKKKKEDGRRRKRKMPLTPEEVGLMLRALGYGSNVHIYVASSEVYVGGGEETLAPLKDTIANRMQSTRPQSLLTACNFWFSLMSTVCNVGEGLHATFFFFFFFGVLCFHLRVKCATISHALLFHQWSFRIQFCFIGYVFVFNLIYATFSLLSFMSMSSDWIIQFCEFIFLAIYLIFLVVWMIFFLLNI